MKKIIALIGTISCLMSSCWFSKDAPEFDKVNPRPRPEVVTRDGCYPHNCEPFSVCYACRESQNCDCCLTIVIGTVSDICGVGGSVCEICGGYEGGVTNFTQPISCWCIQFGEEESRCFRIKSNATQGNPQFYSISVSGGEFAYEEFHLGPGEAQTFVIHDDCSLRLIEDD